MVLPGLFLLLLWLQVHWVAETNFGGFDEWVVLDLNARGIVSVPYANRPLGLVWSLPASAAWARGFGLRSFTLLYALYVLAAAAILYRLGRRLAPAEPALALLVAVFFVVWAPGDLARLSTIERALYAGITLGAVACSWAFLESWFRGSVSLLAAACFGVALLGRSYEGALGLLAGVPLLLFGAPRGECLRGWIAAWEATIAASLAWSLHFFLASPEPAYQLAVLRPDKDPLLWLARMGWQYVYHLAPLVVSPIGELAAPGVAPAVLAFLVLLALHARSQAPQASDHRTLVRAGVAGLVLAGLGYSLIVLGTRAPTAFRLQFMSGPGISLALAAAIVLVSRLAPTAARHAVVGFLAAWVVAVGTGRTVAMQRIWDKESLHAPQSRVLAKVAAAIPDVKGHTLLVLFDERGAWRASFGFHHAVSLLYGGRAAGFVPGVWDVLYPVRFAADGVHFEPWPVLRRPWRAETSRYDYGEIIVLRDGADGNLRLVEDWPRSLAPLPEGASYTPRGRIASAARVR